MHVTCPHYYSEGMVGESEAQFVDRLLAELEQLILQEGPETIAAFIAGRSRALVAWWCPKTICRG